MDLNVEFADATIKKIAVSRDCMLNNAIKIIAQKCGLSSVADKLGEFSLAWKDENSDDWIDVSWLLLDIPLKDQGVGGANLILFRKKYFVKNEDMDAIDSSPTLLAFIYHQLHHTFVAGLYKCTAFQAVNIAAVACSAEFSGLEMRAGSLTKTGRLKQILPEEFRDTSGIEQNILKAMQNLQNVSEDEAKKTFVQRIRKLETFGQSFFSVTFPDEEDMGCDVSLLGIGTDFIHWIDSSNMESFTQWDVEQVIAYGDKGNIFSLQFSNNTGISVVSDYARQITQFLQGIKEYNGPTPQQYASPLMYRRSLLNLNTLEVDSEEVEKSSEETVTTAEKYKENNHNRTESSPELTKVKDSNEVSEPTYLDLRSDSVSPQPEVASSNKSSPNIVIKPPVPSKKPPISSKKSPLTSKKSPLLDSTAMPSDDRSPSPNYKSPSPSEEVEDDNSLYATADTVKAPLIVQRIPLNDVEEDKTSSPVLRRKRQGAEGKESPNLERGGLRRRAGKKRPESILREMEEEKKSRLATRRKPASAKPGTKETHSEDEILAPPTNRRLSKLAARKNRALSMRVTPTYKRLEDLEDILEDNLRASSWANEVNPIYDRVAASEVENFIENSEVTYESLNDISGDATKDEESSTATSGTASSNNKRIDIYGDMDEDVFRKQSVTKSASNAAESSRKVSFQEVKDPSEGLKDDMGGDIYQDPDEAMQQAPVTSSNSPAVKPPVDDMGGDDIYQDPTTAVNTSKPDQDPFSDDIYQDPTAIESNKKSIPDEFSEDSIYQDPSAVELNKKPVDNGFGDDSIYQDPTLIESDKTPAADKTAEEDPYQDLSSIQTEVKQSTSKKTDETPPKGSYRSDTLRSTTSTTSITSKQSGTLSRQTNPSMGKRPYKPGQSRLRMQTSVSGEDTPPPEKPARQAPKVANTMKDYSTLLRDYRVFYVKLPTLEVHPELVNINQDASKLIQRLCVIVGARNPDQYNLFVEGACLSGVKEGSQDLMRSADGTTVVTSSAGLVGLTNKAGTKTGTLNYFDTFLLRAFAMLPDQGSEPILMNPMKSLKEQNITTSRILALRLKLAYEETLPDKPLRVPPHIRFHQCWISIVQGNQPVAMDDAIRLAALQYQAYFLDRTEADSVVGFCKPTEFLPMEYSTVRTMSEKVYKEQLTLSGYTRQLAQEVYIHTCSTLPTSTAIFFPVKEPSKKRMKLTPVYLGVSKEGLLRVDIKTKEVLDLWEYRVLKNWAHTENTFMLAFEKKTYPVQTNQGKWIKDLIDFHVKGILKARAAIAQAPQQGRVQHRPQQPQPSKDKNKIKVTAPPIKPTQDADYDEIIYDAPEDEDIYDIPDDLQNLIPK